MDGGERERERERERMARREKHKRAASGRAYRKQQPNLTCPPSLVHDAHTQREGQSTSEGKLASHRGGRARKRNSEPRDMEKMTVMLELEVLESTWDFSALHAELNGAGERKKDQRGHERKDKSREQKNPK